MTENASSVADLATQVNDPGEWVVVLPVAPQPEPRLDVVQFLRTHRPQLSAEDIAQLRKEGWL